MQVPSLGWEDALEKEMATHSSIPAWGIPWTEEPGGLQSMEWQRVGHNWATKQQQQQRAVPRHTLSLESGTTSLYMNFPGGSDGKASVYSVRDLGSIPGLGRFPGEGNGNPLQYSCLENPMDGGAWCRLLSMWSQRVGHNWATSLLLLVLNMIERIYEKPTANSILNGETLKAFPQRSGMRKGHLLLPLPFNIGWKFWSKLSR